MSTTFENKYYVYILLDPTDYYKPFYVGKGTGNRWRDHFIKKKLGENKRKDAKIAKIRRAGVEPVAIKWLENLSESDAYLIEEQLISRFGRRGYDANGVLMNFCDTARPPPQFGPMPQSQKDAISKANKGRKWSDESRRRASEARRGVKRGPPSAETIEKIRQSNIGIKKRKWTEEERQRNCHQRTLRGSLMTDEQREAHGEKIRENWRLRRELYGPSGRKPTSPQ